MSKIVKITEEQYDYLVNEINSSTGLSIIDEALHYPEFLDEVKTEIFLKTVKEIKNMFRKNLWQLEKKEIWLENNLYFDCIELNIRLNPNQDITNTYNYYASSNSFGCLKNGKVIGAEINIVAPVKIVTNPKLYNKGTEFRRIQYCVNHETTHLFDDWESLSNGGESVYKNQKTVSNMNFINNAIDSSNELVRSLRWLAYLSIYTESNAFTQQLMQELEGLNANHMSIMDKYKETVSYNNLKKTEEEFSCALSNANENTLRSANGEIMELYSDTSIPKLNVSQFNGERYYAMLKKWGTRILKKLAKRYFGVVQLYCNRLTENYFAKNCILIH